MSTIWAELAQWICSPPYDTRYGGSGGRTLLPRRFVLHLTASARKIGQPVLLLVANKHIRIVREDGSLLRELTLDPTRDYQPLGTPLDAQDLSAMSRDMCPQCPET